MVYWLLIVQGISSSVAGTMSSLPLKVFARRLWNLVCSCVFILPVLTARTFAFGSLYLLQSLPQAALHRSNGWKTGHRPLLGDLGHMKIHLLAGNQCLHFSQRNTDRLDIILPLSSTPFCSITSPITSHLHRAIHNIAEPVLVLSSSST